eukprot:TRINITY_DN2103_c0_g1_i1.p1 TRINITY_DN2103_c0_g1~~TRINITY_DN2103_c0_g1_i1.p1  ORF type:complete len:740 (-),score=156.62 TRINITY_DN2103_c0_g1_i1:44-2263(-)
MSTMKARPGTRVLLVDNYDSFTYNVAQYLSELGAEVDVVRNDAVPAAQALEPRYTHIVISPGPGHPAEAGISLEVIRLCAGIKPVLGVCLGHQAIYHVFGGTVASAGEIKHGKTSVLSHNNTGVFKNLPQRFRVVRYHSLAGTRATLPACLEVTAQTDNGIIQGVRHREMCVEGVQFHPESIFSEHGKHLFWNFLQYSGGTASEKSDILSTIMMQRRLDVEAAKARVSQADVVHQAHAAATGLPVVDFYAALTRNPDSGTSAIIGEIKRASPSKGDINTAIDPAAYAQAYAQAGVSAISVLTEPTWFKGTLEDMARVRHAVAGMDPRPAVLRKDFLFDEYQVYEARAHGADTVLLIVKCLADSEVRQLLAVSRSLGMEPLVEVNNAVEMERAVACGARIIGINNRNLTDFTVDLDTTTRLSALVPAGVVLVALSGISTRADVAEYERHNIRCVLVGESIMKAADPQQKIQELTGKRSLKRRRALETEPEDGEGGVRVKICGVSDVETARVCVEAGADFIGLVFAPGSKRAVTVETGRKIAEFVRMQRRITNAALRAPAVRAGSEQWASTARATEAVLERSAPLLVGVFADQNVSRVAEIAQEVGLDIVQFSGNEGFEVCSAPQMDHIVTWRAVHVSPGDTPEVVRAKIGAGAGLVLLDTKGRAGELGGTGLTFDWSVAAAVGSAVPQFVLAGGLDPDNVGSAIAVARPWGVDVSSGVETDGRKDGAKIRRFVAAAKQAR